MPSSIIGQLRVILGLDTAQFERGLSDSQRQMSRAARSYEQIGGRIEKVGKSLSIGLTLPLVAIGGAALKMAATFESAMNKVEAATGATGKELKALRDQAKAFGADSSVPATAAQTASAMENLAKNGRSVSEILGGATEATLKLSAATGGDLPAAADLATDIMAQFGKSAGELPALVDKISGAMVASKLDFDNYRLAIGQAGSIAGNIMGFEEFNAAIAATAAGFASGSDAGTSFKTFLQRLKPQSKEAQAALDELGISFFDAKGNFIGISAAADILQQKVKGLNQEAQSDFLTKVFGSDSARTAIELMKQGSDGIARMSAEINNVKASDQAAALMKGWEGAGQQVKKAFESAAISIGDSGFLTGMTSVALAIAEVMRSFASLPQPALVAVGVFAAVAAAVGPVVFVVGKLFSTWGMLLGLLPRLAIQLGIIAGAETAVGAAGVGAAGGVRGLGAALALLGGAWPVVILAIAGALGVWALRAGEAGEATQEAAKGLRELEGSQRAAEAASHGLATATAVATDKMEAAIVKARDLATQLYGVEAGAKAAMLALAKQRLEAAKAAQQHVADEDSRSPFARMMGVQKGSTRADKADDRRAAAAVERAKRVTDLAKLQYDEAVMDTIGKRFPVQRAPVPTASGGGGGSGSGSKKTGSKGGGSGAKVEDLAAKRAELQLQAELDAAQERGDEATSRALRDRMDLTRQIAAYESAGLKKGEATIAAQRDLSAIQAARAERQAKEVIDQQKSVDLDVAQISGNQALIEKMERQRDIQDRINFYRAHGYELVKATAQAEADQLRVDQARAAIRNQWFEQDARERAIRLAEARGDSEESIRALRQADDIANRTRDLTAQGMNPAEAQARAATEALEEEQARQIGIWRDTIKGGFRAALDGNIGDWFQNWWKDRVAKGMEQALNSLSDVIMQLFSSIKIGGGGGGILGAIGKFIGTAAGGGSVPTGGGGGGIPIGDIFSSGGISGNFPGFKDGGSFKVGGMAGVDRNLVSFRATAGEIVDVRKAGGDNGNRGGGTVIHQKVEFSGGVDLATRTEVYRVADAARQAAVNGVNEAARRRG